MLDASAVIAYVFRERGAERVEARIPGGLITAVNLSEVFAWALEKHIPLEKAEFELGRLPLTVVPFDASLAKLAAGLKAPTRPLGLSLADRACLALGMDRGLTVVTGDRDWEKAALPVKIELFR